MIVILAQHLNSFLLSSLMFQPTKTINDIDDLMSTNLPLMTGNWSYVWYMNDRWEREDRISLFIDERKVKGVVDWDDNVCMTKK